MSASAATSRPGGLNRHQLAALVTCNLVNLQDGFDILAIAYAANDIAASFALSDSQLGLLLSAGLAGMMLGALVLGSVADRLGRKTVTLIGLAISGIGMLGAALATALDTLLIARVMTGFGVGGVLASLNTLASELVAPRLRGIAVAIFQVGYPAGAVLGGAAAAVFLEYYDWRSIFFAGAVLSAMSFLAILFVLPESPSYLWARRGKAARHDIARIHSRLGLDPMETPTEPDSEGQPATATSAGRPMAELLGSYLGRTLLIWTAFFCLLGVLYFVLSWLPKLVADMGAGRQAGTNAGMLVNLAGVAGIVVMSRASLWVSPVKLGTIYLTATGAAMLALALATSSQFGMMAAIGVLGFCVHGSMISLYSLTPYLYPARLRATGTGWAIGLSRLGAVFGPSSAGYLMGAGWSAAGLYVLFGLPCFLAAAAIFAIGRLQSFKPHMSGAVANTPGDGSLELD